ncbi:MAG: sugar ABC transporter substrate-binding protein [Clostridium sp.]|uniref:ABC transporter substrate-binding protein n=1 Tax=Clostridium sp. TaxID=1506 RepID=UPI0029157F79|nr:sugar ABC transporter substrate-binding protein [Clostridium sp.]MDU7337754.1 sugar ABC transporter substrate-binding protein [Clostridium sp.]
MSEKLKNVTYSFPFSIFFCQKSRKNSLTKTLYSFLGVFAILLSGCSGSAITPPSESTVNNPPPTTVKFWTYCTTPERDQDFLRFQQLLKEKNPEIKLEYLGLPGDSSTFMQKLDVAIASDTAPDFTDFYDSKYIKYGFYEPLDAFYNTWSERDTLGSAAIAQARAYDPKQHRLYTLPFSMQPWGMWVRPDQLQSVGLSVPQTWEELFTAAQTLTNRENDRYGIALRGGPGSSNTLEALMYAYSGIPNYFDKNGNCTINNPLHVEFVQKYLGLYNRYSAQDDLVKGWTQLTASFQAGKAGIIFHNFGSGTSIATAFYGDQTRYRAAVFPKAKDSGKQMRFVAMRSVSMNSKSKVKDAAFQAMTLYCSAEVQIPRCKTQGEVPVCLDANLAAGKPDERPDYLLLAEKIVAGKDGSAQIMAPVYLPQYSEIQAQMEPKIQKVMTGSLSANDMLEQWASLLEAAKRDFERT